MHQDNAILEYVVFFEKYKSFSSMWSSLKNIIAIAVFQLPSRITSKLIFLLEVAILHKIHYLTIVQILI